MRNVVLRGNVAEQLTKLPDNHVQCIVTSPPYWGLRDYGIPASHWPEIRYTIFGFEIIVPEQECVFGLEKTDKDFVGHMVHVCREAKRVLRDDGVFFLNLGDSYAGAGGSSGHDEDTLNMGRKTANYGAGNTQALHRQRKGGSSLMGGKNTLINSLRNYENVARSSYVKPKDMYGIPWMCLFALRDDGWYARQDDIWFKNNPMPESVTDRCTKAHEYIFHLTKKRHYFFDSYAIKEPLKEETQARMKRGISENHKNINGAPEPAHSMMQPRANINAPIGEKKHIGGMDRRKSGKDWIPTMRQEASAADKVGGRGLIGHSGNYNAAGELIGGGLANARSVWSINTQGYKGAHFATFPIELPTKCLKAGTSAKGSCASCGSPWRRLLKPSERYAKVLGQSYFEHGDDLARGMQNTRGQNRQNEMRQYDGLNYAEYESIGWQPTCECNGKFVTSYEEYEGRKGKIKNRKVVTYVPSIPLEQHPILPCIGMDLFAGSGTTLEACVNLHLDYVGIEISDAYIHEHIIPRMRECEGLFSKLKIV